MVKHPYRHSSQKTLGDIGHDDANKEDDSIQPRVAKYESREEKGYPQKHGHTSDDVDEMGNLFGYGGLSYF